MDSFVNTLKLWNENITYGIEQILRPVLVFAFFFMISSYYHWRKMKNEIGAIDNEKFKTYIISHLVACSFALTYLIGVFLLNKNPEIGSWFSWILIGFFIYSMIKIIFIQNKDNDGYIENMDDASGVLLFISSILEPKLFLIIYSVAIVLCFIIYKITQDRIWFPNIIKLIIECIEAMVSCLAVWLFMAETVICFIWLNVIMIGIFSLVVPIINAHIFERIDNQEDNTY